MLRWSVLSAAVVAVALVPACSRTASLGPGAENVSGAPRGQIDGAASTQAMPGTITVALVGDVMLGRLVGETIAREGFAYPWGNVLPSLQEPDLFLVNLETTLTAHTVPEDPAKIFHFRAAPEVAATLTAGRVDFASVANNHIRDFGIEGMNETLSVLDAAGIAYAGAGSNLPSAARHAVLSAGGLRVAVVAYADYPPEWAATPDSSGTNHTLVSIDPEHFARVADSLAEARREADLVIFSIHWGPNMRARSPEAFRQFARRVVESGADVFWGHSAHVVQGVEVYKGKLILYDTGDFVDDYMVDERLRNDLSALFLVRATPPVIDRLDLLPVQIGNMQVNLAEGADRKWIVRQLTELSEELGTEVTEEPHGLSIQVPRQ